METRVCTDCASGKAQERPYLQTLMRAHYIPPGHQLADARPVNLSDFMVPATVGSVAGFVAGLVARALMDGEHDTTKDAAAYIVNSGVFLLVGGLTWVVRQSRDQ